MANRLTTEPSLDPPEEIDASVQQDEFRDLIRELSIGEEIHCGPKPWDSIDVDTYEGLIAEGMTESAAVERLVDTYFLLWYHYQGELRNDF